MKGKEHSWQFIRKNGNFTTWSEIVLNYRKQPKSIPLKVIVYQTLFVLKQATSRKMNGFFPEVFRTCLFLLCYCAGDIVHWNTSIFFIDIIRCFTSYWDHLKVRDFNTALLCRLIVIITSWLTVLVMMICSSPVVHVPLIIIIVICSLVAIMSFVGRAALHSLIVAIWPIWMFFLIF